MARVLWISILSRHLVMMKSIICQCLERGCIQVVLRSSFCLNMVFVTISSNSEHRASRSSPLELHFPIPCLPMTKGHLSLSLPILALKSHISSSLSVSESHRHDAVTYWPWHFCQLCDDILFDSKAHSGLLSFSFGFATPEERVFQVVETTRL